MATRISPLFGEPTNPAEAEPFFKKADPLPADLDLLSGFARGGLELARAILLLCAVLHKLESVQDRTALAARMGDIDAAGSGLRDMIAGLLPRLQSMTRETRALIERAPELPGMHSRPIRLGEFQGASACEVAVALAEHVLKEACSAGDVADLTTPLSQESVRPHVDAVQRQLETIQMPATETLCIQICQEISRAARVRQTHDRSKTGGTSSRKKNKRAVPSNGPIKPNAFVWDEQKVELSCLQWKLLAFLWERKTASIADVLDQLYGHDHDEKDAALGAVIKRLTAQLSKRAIPVELHVRGGNVILEVVNSG